MGDGPGSEARRFVGGTLAKFMVEPSQPQAADDGSPMDRYVVLEYLAEGGMGAIYLGKKLGAGGFEREVVLKQLLPEFTRQPEFIDLFLREARLSASLDHANIIHTIDLVTAGDEYFIVMEYLPGADLRTLLKKARRGRGRFSPAAGIYCAREVLSALSYAHSRLGPDGTPLGLIHRDISPSNILISKNGEVKLTDFGIAKASTHNSVFYRVKGKIGYMSPEQARSESLDSRSDLYSLAVCLYEMITGERLFVQASLTTSAADIYDQPVPMVSRKIPGVPVDLDKLMLRALAVDPNARFQTAGEFAEALLALAHRYRLMMSAPELAHHLHAICGDPRDWRNVDAVSTRATSAAIGGTEIARGTEIYDPSEDHSTDMLDFRALDLADDSAELIEVVDGSEDDADVGFFDAEGFRRQRQRTSITKLGRLQGIELTSLINFTEVGSAGAEPLVDLDRLGDTSAAHTVPATAPSAEDDDDSSNAPVDRTPMLPLRAPERQPAEMPEQPADEGSGRWLVVAAILLLGIGIAAGIGFSGPTLSAQPSSIELPTSR
jgi:serine/threonine protein kinase